VTPETRRRAAFELLRFVAAPVSGDLVVVELEGRFAQPGRFTRQPLLVVEDDAAGRSELSPVHAAFDGDRWRAVYALPVPLLHGGRFALGLRGTLLDLPTPDLADGGDRLAALAREANGLRRRLHAAEDDAAVARAEAGAADRELGAAVAAARDAAELQAAERIAELEAELLEARRDAATEGEAARTRALEAQEDALATARAEHEEALARLRADHDAAHAELTARVEAAQDAAGAAEQRARAAEEAAAAAEAGTSVLRAELAEERERAQQALAALQQRLDEATAGRDVPAPDDGDAEDTAVALPVTEPARPRTLSASAPTVVSHPPAPRSSAAAGPSRWVAVAALLLFAFVLLGLLFGFLG
jgi:hypothetical protein